MILVIGQPRTGTSLVMQMLALAGADCLGEPPAYEADAFKREPYDFDGIAERQAIKLLPGGPFSIPRQAVCLITTRDAKQQVASFWKFVHLVGLAASQVPASTRNDRRRIRKSFERDRQRIHSATRGRRQCRINFEDLIECPSAIAAKITEAIGFGDFEAMIKAVIRRSSDNYPGLLESRLLEVAIDANKSRKSKALS